ncbi:MAG: M18 family aminopeptidase [Clostridiales bacterium]|nr:M18 family aminopeptidase [Clostridiales bacterium]
MNMKITNQDLFTFIEKSPTAFHATKNIATRLIDAGYTRLYEDEEWHITEGGFFVCRNDASIIAFRIASSMHGFHIIAAHTDSPSFKLKTNASLSSCRLYSKLNTEKYGGMIYSSWFDRPLSIAGRITKETPEGIQSELINIDQNLCLIPNVAIHMQRDQNNAKTINPQIDTLPLISAGGKQLEDIIDMKDVLSADLYLYNRDKGFLFGAEQEFIGAPRLDDLQCVFAALQGFLHTEPSTSIPLFCAFDSEEIGSATRQGADSTFLCDVLKRICLSIGISEEQAMRMYANSFFLSADNAHAIHPNHPELHDEGNYPILNGGIVIKHNAAMNYTSDSMSSAIIQKVCSLAGVPCQHFSFRSDHRCSHTLGPLALTHLSIPAADIGLAQLAMHSAFETAGAHDTAFLAQMAKQFYSVSFHAAKDTSVCIQV